MKLLFTSANNPEVGLLKDLLDQAGILSEVRNENLYSNFPGAPFQPELWVLNDDDYPKACEIRDTNSGPSPGNRPGWFCHVCGEESEGPFEACWKCGTPRIPSAS